MEIKKPLILSVDTSAINCTVAISEEEKILAAYSVNIKRLHDRLLADFTKRALADLSISFSEIDAVAISSGPGSFTGLRIGASFVKGLTTLNKPKLIALPTLQLFSIQSEQVAKLTKKNSIVSLIAANSNMMYTQEFDLKSNPMTIPNFIHLKEFMIKENIFYNGDGSNLFPQLLDFSVSSNISPETLSIAAYRYFLENKFIDSANFEPEYIQEFVFKES